MSQERAAKAARKAAKPRKTKSATASALTDAMPLAPVLTPPTAIVAAPSLITTASRAQDILKRMPDASMRTVLDELSREDPALWCMYYRRLRGHPMVFDYSRHLTPAALDKLHSELFGAHNAAMAKERYDRELRNRLLRHRPFLIEPMRDQHPHKVYRKARQVGISEQSINEVFHFLWANPTKKWIYTFPRDTQLKDFSATRIAEALIETPRMRGLVGVPNQTYTKKIGNSYLILRSAWESNLGEGIDADGVTLDEKDRMKDGVEVAFRESLASSSFGWLREVSTPTLPGRGVDASFIESDQRHWLMRCSKCGLEQEIEWPDNIQQTCDVPLGTKELPPDSYAYVCRLTKCRGLIDRLHGRWVAKKPSKINIRGYHMPQTIAPWIDATKLMQKKIDYKFHQLWINYCLGMPAMGENVLLSDADFEMANAQHPFITRRTSDWQNITVGVDWGHLNWCVVMAQNVHTMRHYIINIGVFEDDHANELTSVKAIESFIAPYAPDMIVADAGYGKDRNAYLLRKFGAGKFYACWYNPSTRASRTFQPVWSAPDAARLLVDRTMTIKVTCRAIKEREFGLPDLSLEKVALLKKHFKNLAPLRIEEEGEIIEDISATGDDHLVHATAYAYIAIDQLSKTGHFAFDFV